MESTRGKLLVAAPPLRDPNFRQTVLLMLEHSDQGALGVVLNRPSKFPTRRAVADWQDFVVSPQVVFVGGPVSRSSLIGVASAAFEDSGTSWRPVADRIGTVDLSTAPAEVGGAAELRVFAGYAAWEPGQLEAEMAEDSWFVLRHAPSDPFSTQPKELWWQVFARQEDAGLRQIRLFPRNPSDN